MGISAVIINMGGAIVKSIVKMWLGDNDSLEPVSDNLIDLFTKNSINVYDSRSLVRNFESIGDKIAGNFISIFDEFNIEEGSKIAISEEVSRVISNFKITHELLLKISNNPKELYNRLLNSTESYKKYFGEAEQQLYIRCLDLSSQYIIDIAPNLPNYTRENFHEIMRRFDKISKKIDELLEETKLITVTSTRKSEQDFERDYRNSIIRKYNKINLFGANNLERNMRIYDLSIAYVDLEVSKYDIDDDDEYKISVSDVFNDNNVVLIKGEAGSGKTTFLQWLSVNTASGGINEKIDALRNFIPIVIELRKIKEWPINLSQYITMMIKDVVSKIPDNWIGNVLKSGHALLLIDGLDEISKNQRENVLLWIEELVETYNLKIIITTRPSVNEKLRCEYTNIEILPMNQRNIEKFIDYWHNAVLIEQGIEKKEDAEIIKKKLNERIYYNEPISKLASNPLLCAMLCALHYKNNLVLPSDRNELYEECCKMLLDSRDSAREIKIFDKIELNYREKRAILDDLAYWMIRNGQVSISIDVAKDRIIKKANNMKIIESDLDIHNLLKYFIERSGVIREPEIRVIDFLHKTFQEYMAAKEASNQGDWGLLVENADKESWYETIILAISFASEKNADFVIKELLKKANSASPNSIGYKLIAMACTESALGVSPKVRESVERVTKELIPPKMSQCKEIAMAGTLAIPYLSYKENYTDNEQIACIRTLKIIGSRSTLPIVTTYINKNVSKPVLIEIERLLRTVNRREVGRCDLGDAIIKHILITSDNMLLEINHTFLTSISEVPNVTSKLKELNTINTVKINNFNGEVFEYMPFHDRLKILCIEGNFRSFKLLSNIKTLEYLSIVNTDSEFDIYELKKYKNLRTLRKLCISIQNDIYFNPNEFENFKRIEELEISFNASKIEFFISGLSEYTNLKKLKLGGKFVTDLELEELTFIKNLEYLELECSSDLLQGIITCLTDLYNLRKITFNIDKSIIDEDDLVESFKLFLPECDINFTVIEKRIDDLNYIEQ
jgi:hypothetical protein